MSSRSSSRSRPSGHKPTAAVSSLETWLQAWTAYAATIIEFHPPHSVELLGYQAVIANTVADHRPEFWLQYDRRFCWRAAHDPNLRWDRIDSHTWSYCLINQSSIATTNLSGGRTPSLGITCYACRETGHFASAYPRIFRDPPAEEPGRGAISGTKQEPSKRLLVPPVCIIFNRGTCHEPSICRYRHICSRSGCGGNHPATKTSCSLNRSLWLCAVALSIHR